MDGFNFICEADFIQATLGFHREHKRTISLTLAPPPLLCYNTPKAVIILKKKIIIGVFSLLILITAIFFVVVAIDSYNYDMAPANGVDILEGFGAVLILMVGGFVVFL